MNKEFTGGLIGGLVILVVFLGGFILINTTVKNVAEKENEAKIISEMKEGFMGGCMSESTTYTMCSCAFDKLLATWGMEKFISVSLDYNKTGILPEGAVATIIECVK